VSPSNTNGKICYVELPATDIKRSAEFYQKTAGMSEPVVMAALLSMTRLAR
jgi:predicted enzyme related to lactoylglutathione lyase